VDTHPRRIRLICYLLPCDLIEIGLQVTRHAPDLLRRCLPSPACVAVQYDVITRSSVGEAAWPPSMPL
jgi:hypothetical protein